ncbi:DUF421 domain-containing protein [Deinococcus oregonensis]|uniref:DUF421 domain-containing protein n=1 Tax=Deinococcus oregonensis TaxID=1805970 RepID=A0ABV6B4S6_9DEIO
MNELAYFFSGWAPLFRILVIGTLLFLLVVLLLRFTSNRTLSSLTTFDFIVAVAVGAVFGRALTATDLSLSEALLAITLLLGLQYLLSYLKFKSKTIARMIDARPVVLFLAGVVQEEALHREHLTYEDILSAIRSHGYHDLTEVDAVILEATGGISVLDRKQDTAS